MLTEADIHRAYKDAFLRSADPSGLNHFRGRELSFQELEDQLKASPEYKEHIAPIIQKIESSPRPRVLIFGAYGNGNLGDNIQAAAVADLMASAVPGISCWSTSLFVGPYPRTSDLKAKLGTIYSNPLLRLFDMLVIGGGGLLAHPHDPLDDPNWVARLPRPTVLLGVGANGSFVDQTAALLRKAEFVGCRDPNSLRCVSIYTTRTALVLDPVLISSIMRPSARSRRENRFDCCWIVRDPIDDVVRNVASLVGPKDIVIGLEPHQDRPLTEVFRTITFVDSLEQFWEIITTAKRIVSMRYHGVILGLRAGIPSYALRVDKARFLLELLGLKHLIIDDLNGFCPSCSTIDIERQVAEFRELYLVHFKSLLKLHSTNQNCVTPNRSR